MAAQAAARSRARQAQPDERGGRDASTTWRSEPAEPVRALLPRHSTPAAWQTSQSEHTDPHILATALTRHVSSHLLCQLMIIALLDAPRQAGISKPGFMTGRKKLQQVADRPTIQTHALVELIGVVVGADPFSPCFKMWNLLAGAWTVIVPRVSESVVVFTMSGHSTRCLPTAIALSWHSEWPALYRRSPAYGRLSIPARTTHANSGVLPGCPALHRIARTAAVAAGQSHRQAGVRTTVRASAVSGPSSLVALPMFRREASQNQHQTDLLES